MIKKFFTLKNILIVLFLLSAAAYFCLCNIYEFENIKRYNAIIAANKDAISYNGYLLLIRNGVTIVITNFIIAAFIFTFIVLFCISSYKQLNFLKFAFITLLFACFITYMLQIDIPWFIMPDPKNINLSYLPKVITALIALLISIACYVYLLLKEIKKRKEIVTEQIHTSENNKEQTQSNEPTQE